MRHKFHENVRFCPKCGVESLERDMSHQAGESGQKQVKSGTEWWCRICGFGFWINKSHRWYLADELHRHHRMLRGGVTFTEECVGTPIAKAFASELEKGNEKT